MLLTQGPPLVWTRPDKKVGDTVTVSADGEVVSRSAQDGWGVQIIDTKFSYTKDAYDKITVALECEALSGATHMGLVGINYLDWNAPLHESKHSVVVRVSDGAIIQKGVQSTSSVGAIKAGAQYGMPVI